MNTSDAMRTMLLTGALAAGLMAGCSTTTRGPSDPLPEPPPPAAAPTMNVDPWARSAAPVAAAPAAPEPAAAPAPAVAETPAAETPTPETPTAAASGPRTHTVVKGDTLYAISVKYYGTGSKWPKIIEANPGLKPEVMPVGKKLVIP